MTLGFDLSPLQSGSRMRGIGYTLINILNNLSDDTKKQHSFVFYVEDKEGSSPLELIDTEGMNYSVKLLESFVPYRHLPRSLRVITKIINMARAGGYRWVGSRRFKSVSGIDVFFQIDHSFGLPLRYRTRSVLFIHDVIPYVMESEYLWSYRTARQRGLSRKGAAGCLVARLLYVVKIKLVVRRARALIANSEWTKGDFVRFFGVNPHKITVCPLGVNTSVQPSTLGTTPPEFNQAVASSWGYLPEPVDLTTKPFLLFIGGADPRRRLVDLVAAFTNLRAQGHDLRLVLTGDSMQSPATIANPRLQEYLKSASYTDDIAFLGFITDEQRDWLYSNALAFVFPSVYEGFGLPILEAMQAGCPVVYYKNTATAEVAGDAAIEAHDFHDIKRCIQELLADPAKRQEYVQKGRKQAAKFSWEVTAQNVLKSLEKERDQ